MIWAVAYVLLQDPSTEERIRRLEERLAEMQEELRQLRAAPAETAPAERKPDEFNVFWKDGVRFETDDGDFKFKIGGRLQSDLVFWTDPEDDVEDAVGRLRDGVEFRRARIHVAGELYEHFEFKAQYDFTDGDADFKDVYIGALGVPVLGSIRFGNQYEPFGLEEQTSDLYITFMERSVLTAFTPERNVGLRVMNTALDDRMTWSAGVFRTTDDFGDDVGDGEYSVTARLTGLPWWEDERHFLHLGAAASRRETDGNVLRIRERPEVHIGPRFVDTGTFRADDLWLLGAEAAVVVDSFSFQGEYIVVPVDRDAGFDDVTFDGWYVQASWFPTGEYRPYAKKEGLFGRVRPEENFWEGPGAWELALRYSSLDLTDDVIAGGELGTWTAGVNWYFNPNTRMQFNYVAPHLEDVGTAGALTVRFQIDF